MCTTTELNRSALYFLNLKVKIWGVLFKSCGHFIVQIKVLELLRHNTYGGFTIATTNRECVRNLDLRMQVHPAELWVSKQRVHIVLEASKSAGAKGDVPKICGFLHPLHPL